MTEPDPAGPAGTPAEATTQSIRINPDLPEERPAPARQSRTTLWAFGVLAVAILAGTLAYYVLYPAGETQRAAPGIENAAPAVRPYLEKAAQGDPNAMRMLGTMYYNGLNVQQNRKEGIRWFRKAVAAGSVAARKDLEQMGLAVEEK